MSKKHTVIFHETVFGPIHSRRLGVSLGINLMPNDGKTCSFDCLYCEAGLNSQGAGTTGLPEAREVERLLRERLARMAAEGVRPDVITFSGNGEPTLHPQFEEIVAMTRRVRDELAPQARISVLTNATRLHMPPVVRALHTVDNNILKLDSAVEETMRLIDRPASRRFTVARLVEQLKEFSGEGIIQTMLLRGFHRGRFIDNTTDAEVEALIAAYNEIRPASVMLYSIDRETPVETLRAVPREELEAVAERVRAATGLPVSVS